FNESGGWAANVNANLALSDLGMVNFSLHKETAGFGGVDQGLSARRLDDYTQYNVAVQGDIGKLLPAKAKLSAPIYYSRSNERTTPKYNPLDQDILLKDALDAVQTKHEKDSIRDFAITTKNVESFSISNLKFNVQSKNPMPWDPANFQVSFSFNKQRNADPTTEYQNTFDYRGSFQYSYSPYVKPLKPFSFIKGKSRTAKYFKDWGINWMFNNLTFLTNMTRYYYEEQSRSEADVNFRMPVQVSKNFLWDRQLNLTWNLLQSLSFSFASNTTARIEETVGAVNKRLFPDKYREWRDTVWSSIKSLGTPWNYNQTFTGTYRAPFNKIPVLDYLTGSLSYSSVYRWDKGATVDGLYLGNSIQNQTVWNADARLNFETLYNKSKYLQAINKRFAKNNSRTPARGNGRQAKDKEKKFERAVTLLPDTSTFIRHNLKTKKVKVSALDGNKVFKLNFKVVDDNSIEVLNRGDNNLKITVREDRKDSGKSFLKELGDYSLRFLMMPRSLSFKWRSSHSLNLPQFAP
ncbi:MAG: cell surface protein SprA, partial [Muribaculaceae bacterium]|nr:cell surface protein SprA [Muribaculaceae bacterium]